jgi:hypothetical protein
MGGNSGIFGNRGMAGGFSELGTTGMTGSTGGVGGSGGFTPPGDCGYIAKVFSAAKRHAAIRAAFTVIYTTGLAPKQVCPQFADLLLTFFHKHIKYVVIVYFSEYTKLCKGAYR